MLRTIEFPPKVDENEAFFALYAAADMLMECGFISHYEHDLIFSDQTVSQARKLALKFSSARTVSERAVADLFFANFLYELGDFQNVVLIADSILSFEDSMWD